MTTTVKIHPKNPEQICLFHMLYDNSISICNINGSFGAGKSFILTNFALQELERGNIRKIVYVPNNSFNRDTREIAAVPGELVDKELMHMGTLLDIVGQDRVRSMIDTEELEVVPMSVMRGRNFDNCFIFVNEAQNLTGDHIALAVGRCGENTRIFFDGDVKQVDSVKFENKSGIRKLSQLSESEDFAPIYGAVKLSTVERSFTAKAAEFLSNLDN